MGSNWNLTPHEKVNIHGIHIYRLNGSCEFLLGKKVIWEDFTTASLSILKSKNKTLLKLHQHLLPRSVDPRQKIIKQTFSTSSSLLLRISIPPTKRSEEFNKKNNKHHLEVQDT